MTNMRISAFKLTDFSGQSDKYSSAFLEWHDPLKESTAPEVDEAGKPFGVRSLRVENAWKCVCLIGSEVSAIAATDATLFNLGWLTIDFKREKFENHHDPAHLQLILTFDDAKRVARLIDEMVSSVNVSYPSEYQCVSTEGVIENHLEESDETTAN
jgi:hypothetical protein